METAIMVIWAVGLLGALVGTAAILKLAALVLRTLRHLLYLAERTAAAADGTAGNLQAITRLAETHEPADHMARVAATLRESLEKDPTGSPQGKA